ncbi:ferritin-like domain-containing protein [Mariniplasma anaerobium]|uniref:DUF2202 domain-containing protein n=1 Tax=Mariniplasma anaerobium TaxID=2735436 RepID=A0A7U9TH72_9MOLU|nr:DUF2202 domain-containing protein [Mariniplasma anaerobium]BCR35746.1 hypothetical protein MPAN_006390 [Mariniplasma anaerobium]
MKQFIIGTILLFSLLLLSGCETISEDSVVNTLSPMQETIDLSDEFIELDDDSYGSVSALDQTTFTIEEMLIYALQDEYAARAEYDYVLSTFDITRPFSNIIKSEETHISLLLPLFDTYNLSELEDTSDSHLISIGSVEEAFDIGVQAEILNIAMYNLFLEQDDLPDDVKEVFVKLRDASMNHLDAFEKNAAKS